MGWLPLAAPYADDAGQARIAPYAALLTLGVGSAALGATCAAMQAVARLGAEEDSGRLALVLAVSVSRRRVWTGWSFVVMAQGVAMVLVPSLAYGLTAWWSVGEAEVLAVSVRAAAVLTVPVLATVALALAARGIAPRWSPLPWLVITWGAVVAFLAPALDLPRWARDLSPFFVVGNVPVEAMRWGPLLGLSFAALVLVVLSVEGIARRDLRRG